MDFFSLPKLIFFILLVNKSGVRLVSTWISISFFEKRFYPTMERLRPRCLTSSSRARILAIAAARSSFLVVR